MGVYIDKNSEGKSLPARGKFKALIADGAVEVETTTEKWNTVPVAWNPDLVCVVENGPFDAAGWAYSKQEMKSFAWMKEGVDERPRRWLWYPHVKDTVHNYADFREQYPNG